MLEIRLMSIEIERKQKIKFRQESLFRINMEDQAGGDEF